MICDDDFYAGKCTARKEDGTCISKFPCSHKVEPPKPPTNSDRIRGMSDKELAEFLEQIAYARETPWSELFAEKFCKSCPETKCEIPDYLNPLFLHECDFTDGKCPHGSDIVWWLQQPAEGDGNA